MKQSFNTDMTNNNLWWRWASFWAGPRPQTICHAREPNEVAASNTRKAAA